MRVLAIVLVTTGCSQLFGLEQPTLNDAAVDAPADDMIVIDDDNTIVTLTLQENSTYAGTRDTYLDDGAPNGDRSNDSRLRWRAGQRYALIAFDPIFADNAVPGDANLITAKLELAIDQGGSPANVSEVAIDWAETVTFNTFGGSAGIDPGDIGAAVGTLADVIGVQTVDVTASLTRWQGDPSTNHGWIINASMVADGAARSSEDGVEAARPRLTVTYRR